MKIISVRFFFWMIFFWYLSDQVRPLSKRSINSTFETRYIFVETMTITWADKLWNRILMFFPIFNNREDNNCGQIQNIWTPNLHEVLLKSDAVWISEAIFSDFSIYLFFSKNIQTQHPYLFCTKEKNKQNAI